MNKQSESIIIIPAYNEEKSIASVIDGCKKYAPGVDLVIINDGSLDKTTDVCKLKNVNVINLPFNLGVGTALQTGYKYAERKGYKYLIQLDSDGQHDPQYIPQLLDALVKENNDFVIASRFIGKEKYSGGWIRNIGILFFSKLLTLLLKEKLTDPTSGYRGMNYKVLKYCTSDLYNFEYPDANFILSLHMEGFKFKEVPVHMHLRLNGNSQYHGLKPVYYVIKMMLSLFIVTLRPRN